MSDQPVDTCRKNAPTTVALRSSPAVTADRRNLDALGPLPAPDRRPTGQALGVEAGVELERYELREAPAYQFGFTRRELLHALGGGLMVLLTLRDAEAQESGRGRRGSGRGPGPAAQPIGAWLHLGPDGAVTVFTGKAEVGQNIRTSLSQAVAEELRVRVSSIRLVMADTDRVPYDMGTFGSRTTPTMAPQLRRAAAAAREMLIDLAAAQWHVDRAGLLAAAGHVTDPGTKRSLSYSALATGQSLAKTVPEDVGLTPADHWTIAGASVPKVDGRAMVTGTHKYASDHAVPGMAFGKVLRAPAFGATLTSLDTVAAATMPGITVVRDGEFAGVVGPEEATAQRALDALVPQWKRTPQPSSSELFDLLKRDAPAGSPHDTGSMEAGMAAAAKTLHTRHTIAYIAHVPLEPRAALAEWKDGKLSVWTGTQRPFGVRSELAQAFRLPEERVRVIVPDTGSAYGGKHTGEAAVEAARLAKAAGKPVKLRWTRQEEMTWAYFRPAGVIEISSGAKSDGTLTAWEHHNYNSGPSAIATPYEVPNQRIQFHSSNSPLRQGSYRGLAATANHFARETHMDELAHALEMDPLAFRLKNLHDPRLRAVFQAAADRFGWGRVASAPGHGVGLAGGVEKGSYVATCAEVLVDRATGRVHVLRAVTAFDCGAVVNPEHLKNQIEGAQMMGLGGGLFEAIDFDNGVITTAHLAQYRVPRFTDAPAFETLLIDRRDLPSAGAGETPIVGIAPAVGNAIFHATGVRLRSLPMAPNGVPKAGA